MTDYKSLYFQLFNGISDIIGQLEQDKESQCTDIISSLKQLQIEAEEAYLLQEEQ